MVRAELTGHYRDDGRYPFAIVNITNRCNLTCRHCFVYRDGNPNEHLELAGEPESMVTTFVGGPKRLPIRYRVRSAA